MGVELGENHRTRIHPSHQPAVERLESKGSRIGDFGVRCDGYV